MEWVTRIEAVLALFLILAGIIGGFWKLILGLRGDLNGYGERLTKAENNCTVTAEKAARLRADVDMSIADRREIHQDLGELKGKVEAMREEIRDDRLAVMTTLHNIEKAAAERDADLKVELARLKERMDMNQLVATIVKEVRKQA